MSIKAAQAPAPAIAETGSDKPNCAKSIVEIAADTITMQKSTNPSCGSAVRFRLAWEWDLRRRFRGWRAAPPTALNCLAFSSSSTPPIDSSFVSFAAARSLTQCGRPDLSPSFASIGSNAAIQHTQGRVGHTSASFIRPCKAAKAPLTRRPRTQIGALFSSR